MKVIEDQEKSLLKYLKIDFTTFNYEVDWKSIIAEEDFDQLIEKLISKKNPLTILLDCFKIYLKDNFYFKGDYIDYREFDWSNEITKIVYTNKKLSHINEIELIYENKVLYLSFDIKVDLNQMDYFCSMHLPCKFEFIFDYLYPNEEYFPGFNIDHYKSFNYNNRKLIIKKLKDNLYSTKSKINMKLCIFMKSVIVDWDSVICDDNRDKVMDLFLTYQTDERKYVWDFLANVVPKAFPFKYNNLNCIKLVHIPNNSHTPSISIQQDVNMRLENKMLIITYCFNDWGFPLDENSFINSIKPLHGVIKN
jgi:hypothetical protein